MERSTIIDPTGLYMRNRALKRLAERNSFTSVLYNLPRLIRGYQPIFLDYHVDPIPRYGYGKPPHPQLTEILAAGDELYRRTLLEFLQFAPELLRIAPRDAPLSAEPCWVNKWLDGLDTFSLYGFIASRKPSLYVEVGSGYSTRIVRRAIRDQRLSTLIHSIDPHPRAEIDAICDTVTRERLEDSDLSFVSDLQPGDILFVDSSHRSFMNSDVTVFFLEILPRLKSGVIVHIHDIYLPLDYMPERGHWFYSEQYLLGASLLAGHQNFKILLPNNYISITSQVNQVMEPLWQDPVLQGVQPCGCSFWLEKQ